MNTDWHGWMLRGACLAIALSGCGKGPDLTTPESATRAWCEKVIEQGQGRVRDAVEVEGFELEGDARELEWYADPSDRRKLIDRKRAGHDFVKAHLSELLERRVEIVEVSDAPGGGKKVIARVVGKDVKEKKAGEWELVDDDLKVTLVLTQAGGKWRVKER